MKITKTRLMEIIKEELDLVLEKEINPYAICTASVGRENEKKYKSCKEKVAKQNEETKEENK